MNVKSAEVKAETARRLVELCCDEDRKKILEKRAQMAEVEVGRAKKRYYKRQQGDRRRERPQGLKQL